MVLDRRSLQSHHCEERSDVAISCSGDRYTIEIATLPSVARDDGGFMSEPRKGPDILGQTQDDGRPAPTAN